MALPAELYNVLQEWLAVDAEVAAAQKAMALAKNKVDAHRAKRAELTERVVKLVEDFPGDMIVVDGHTLKLYRGSYGTSPMLTRVEVLK